MKQLCPHYPCDTCKLQYTCLLKVEMIYREELAKLIREELQINMEKTENETVDD